jgi:NlpC/P60 family putative phage cell wall peptidase
MSKIQNVVVRIARAWIGTPYHHQASLRGIGCDCLGLIRGIWREIHGEEPERYAPYTPDWGEVSHEETLLTAARRHLVMGDPAPGGFSSPLCTGDVVVFRMRAGAIAKHAAVISAPRSIIHAQERVGVVEVPIGAWWRRRIVGVFQFPERQI